MLLLPFLAREYSVTFHKSPFCFEKRLLKIVQIIHIRVFITQLQKVNKQNSINPCVAFAHSIPIPLPPREVIVSPEFGVYQCPCMSSVSITFVRVDFMSDLTTVYLDSSWWTFRLSVFPFDNSAVRNILVCVS